MAASARERSRSPRLDGHQAPSTLPLADLLLEKGILDGRSVEFLKKSPRKLAAEVLLSLGPDVRNPSAFVTRKLAPKATGVGGELLPADATPGTQQNGNASGGRDWSRGKAQNTDIIIVHCNGQARPLMWWSQSTAVMELLSWGVLDEGSADFLSKAPEQHAKEIVASLGPDVRNPSAFVTRRLKELRSEADGARRAEAPAPVEQLVVHHKGVPRPLPWLCKEQAAEQLASWGLLDEGSADFLTKAPEHEAKQIVACLGPDVRNPSAFVTRKLKELFREGPPAADAPAAEVLAVHHNGAPLSLRWLSKEQALLDLVRWGVLDEGSADFLMKAPEQEAKDIVACLGPDVRNPSAFVTRKMKERRGGAMQLEQAEPLAAAAWLPLEQLVGQLVGQGILDEGSASFLGRVPEQVARDILASLGPDVRNPSAFVTTKVKAALEGDAPHRVVEAPMVPASGLQEEQLVTVYHGGSRMTLPWHSQVQALRDLVAGGVLDQRSADFLAKIPEKAAKDIVGALGPDVRNPSAFVTKEARKWQS